MKYTIITIAVTAVIEYALLCRIIWNRRNRHDR